MTTEKEAIADIKNVIRQLSKTKSSIEDSIRLLQRQLNELEGVLK